MLVIGGGSVMDVVKVISLLLIYEGWIEDYEGFFIFRYVILFIVVILIIVGIGSEVICFLVIIDIVWYFKMSV